MLYIFHVDTGTMMTFEMSLALESVGQLKEAIDKNCKIPVDKQVLLVSGGECLDPCAKVCSYSAGTDTNPIFLFSKCTLENAKPPAPSIDYGSDSDTKELVDNSLSMPATYNTVAKRAQIAQQFCELAKEHTMVCHDLVHDQHLQQQGWAAAVANLEDITAVFKTKCEMFEQSYRQYLEDREENLKMLQSFSSDLQVLAKIPILDPLIGNALSFSTAEGVKKCEEAGDPTGGRVHSETQSKSSDKDDTSETGAMTLLKWISTADNQSSLEQVAEQARRGLEQFDETVLEALIKEVETTIETADKCEMKEIKGLEERLFGLEQLKVETKKIVQEQTDLAQALQQNQTRASSLNDPSILPDLCASHRKQLLVMLNNQHMLRDIRRRCSKAKEELSINLYHRLGWVMYVENLIVDVSNKLMIYHENLKRLRKYLEITRQVQRTPQVYVAAVSEVVRRRTFSQAFLTWASDLSCRLLAVYNEEYEKRKDFQSQFEGHFLQSLFPGFEDNPPTFATQAPGPFDVTLPQLTNKDIETLQAHLPEVPMSLSATQLSSIAQLFLTGSMTEKEPPNVKENDPVEEKLVVAVKEVGLDSKLDKTLLQPPEAEIQEEGKKMLQAREDKDFESETDTEEFEKVCQSPTDGKTSTGPKSEESCPTRSEVEALKLHLCEAGKLASETATYLKTELVEIKSQSLTDREGILNLVKDIQARVTRLMQRYSEEVEEFQKNLEEVMQSRDAEIESLKKVVEERESQLGEVSEDVKQISRTLEETIKVKEQLNETLLASQRLCEELQGKLTETTEEKVRVVERMTENLNKKEEECEQLLSKVKEEARQLFEEERNKLTDDHRVKMEEIKTALVQSELDAEMDKEKTVTELQEKHAAELSDKLEELRQEMKEEADRERQKAVEEVTEGLTLKYKAEMESLRCRFKLMSATSMEKSPSDSSLEKIEKADMAELVNQETIVAQIKEMAEMEKQKEVAAAVEAEREKMKRLEEELRLEKQRFQEEKRMMLEEAANKAMAERNTQVQMLLAKVESLTTECQRHRNTIKFLTDGEQMRSGSPGAGTVDPLLAKIEVLEKEKMLLASELDKRKARQVDDMSASFAVLPVTDIPNKFMTASLESGLKIDSNGRMKRVQQGMISITSCSVGDPVLVVWNVEHANYTILQETPTLYFLHSDSLDVLGLRPSSDGSPKRMYCPAEVVEKEYCHAKKEENRYKVPKGTKFYRVKVRPVIYSRDAMIRSSHHHRQHQQQQQADATEAQRSVDVAKSCGVQLGEAADPSGTAASGENPVKPETEDGEAPSAAR